MNLKNNYHINVDKLGYGGKKIAVSINQLHNHIPPERAKMIIKSILLRNDFPIRYSVQNKAIVWVYLK